MAKQLNVNLAFTADTSQAKAQILELQKTLQQITTSSKSSPDLFNSKAIREASQAAKELQGHLSKAVDANTGKLNLSTFSASLKASGASLQDYKGKLEALGPSGEKAFLQVSRSIATADAPIAKTNAHMQEFLTTLKNTARWQISSSILHGFMGALQSAYGYAQDLNESLTNIRIVTGQTSEQMARFAENANKSAQALSTTTTKYTDAALIFYQQGLDDKAVKERTDATIKMSQATGDAVKDVSSYMTAIWNNFDNGSQSLEHYADVITALGASTASSSSEIASGLQQFAAIAETTGLSYEYATSALATLVANTRQSADTIGNSLKTIFSRLQGLKLGETLEDGVDLNKYSKALQAIGIDLLDVNGNMMQMDDILDATAEKWDTMSQAQKMAFAQTVAGTRQYTQLMSLMDNWDDMQTNLNTARTADGTLQEQADIYAESWEASSKRVRAAFESIYSNLLNDKFFIGLNDAFATLLKGVNGFIDGIGGVQGAISMLGAMILQSWAKEAPAALQALEERMLSFSGKAKEIADTTQADNIKMLQQESKSAQGSFFEGDGGGQYMAEVSILELIAEKKAQLNQYSQDYSAAEKAAAEAELSDLQETSNLLSAKGAEYDKLNQTIQQTSSQLQQNSKYSDKDILGLEDMSKSLGTLNAISKAMQNFGKAVEDPKKSAQELAEDLLLLAKNGEKFSAGEIRQGFVNIGNDIQALEEKFKNGEISEENFKNRLKEIGEQMSSSVAAGASTLKTQVEGVVGSGEEADRTLQKFSQSCQNSGKNAVELSLGVRNTQTGFQNLKPHIATASEAIVSFAGTLSQINAVISSMTRIKDVFTNEDSTAIQKVGAVIGGVTTLMMAFNAVSKLTKTLMDQEAGSFLYNSVTTKLLALAKKEVAIATTEEAAAETAEAAAAGAAATANAGLLATLLPLAAVAAAVVAAFIALAAVIALVTAAWKSYQSQKPENQLKAAKEEAKNLADAANEAKDKVNELKSAFDSYDSVVDKLENCTKGTQEWRDAMEEVNNQVIDMLQKYPELASYLDSSDPSGLLKFRDGYEEVLANAQNAANSASLASIRKNADVQQQQVDFDKRNFYKDNNINSSQQKIIDENLDKFASIPFELLDSKIEGLNGISEEAYGELQKLSAASAAATAGLENVGAIAANSLDPDKYSQEARNMVANGYNDLVDKNKSDVLNEIGQFGRFGDNVGNNSDLKNLWDEYQKYGGQSGSLDKNSLRGGDADQGRVKEFAYNDDNGDLKTVTAEQVAETIAAGRAMAELGASAEQASAALNNLDKKATEGVSEGIKGFINNGNLENLTQGDMKAIRGQVGEDGSGTEKYLQELFGTDDLKSLGIDPDAFNEALENAETAFDSFKDGFSRYVTNAFNDLDLSNATLSAQKAILEALNDAFAVGGMDGLNAMQDIFKNLLPEDAETFANNINNIDWNSQSVNSLKTTLEELGVDTSNLSDGAMQSLIAAMREASNSAEDLASSFKTQGDIINKLKDGDTIKAEDYDKLDAAYQDYFVAQMDGSYKLVESAEKLQAALKDDFINKFADRAGELANQNGAILHAQNNDNIGASAASSVRGGAPDDLMVDKSQLQDQMALLNSIGEQYGINKEKIQEWNQAIQDGSATINTYQQIANAVKEVCENEDAFNQILNQNSEEINHIIEATLMSCTTTQEFDNAVAALANNLGTLPFESVSEALINIASQYDNTAGEIENLENVQRSANEAIAEAEAAQIPATEAKRDYVESVREEQAALVEQAQAELELATIIGENAQQYGIAADVIEAYAEELANSGDYAGANVRTLGNLATAYARANEGINDLCDNSKNYSKVLEHIKESGFAQAMQADTKNTQGMVKSLSNLLNTSEDVATSLMKDSKQGDNLAKALKGDENAIRALDKEARKLSAIEIGIDPKSIKGGEKALDSLFDKIDEAPEGKEIMIDLQGDEEAMSAMQSLVQELWNSSDSIDDFNANMAALDLFGDLAAVASDNLGGIVDGVYQSAAEMAAAGYVLIDNANAMTDGVAAALSLETDIGSQTDNIQATGESESPTPFHPVENGSHSITLPGASFSAGLGGFNFTATQGPTLTYTGVGWEAGAAETETIEEETPVTQVWVRPRKGGGAGTATHGNRNVSGGGGGGGRGGGGRRRGGRRGGGREARKEYAASQHTDRSHVRYESLNKSLDLMQKKYEKIGIAADHAFGTQRLKLIEQQIKKQKELRDQLQKVADESARLAKNEKALLTKKDSGKKAYYQDKDGKEHSSTVNFEQYGVKFNKDGTIANYGDVLKAVDKRHNDAAKNVNGKTEDAAAAAKEILDKVDAENAVFLEWLEKYESDLAQSLDDANAVLEAQYEIISLSVSKIQEAVEMKINTKQMGLGILDDMLGRIGDNAWRAAESIALLTKQAEKYKGSKVKNPDGSVTTTQGNMKIHENAIKNIINKHNDDDKNRNLGFDGKEFLAYLSGDELDAEKRKAIEEAINNDGTKPGLTKDEIEAIQEQLDMMKEEAQALYEIREQMFETISDTFNKMSEEMDKFTNKIEHLQSMSDHYKNIVEIVGADTLGITKEMQKEMNQASVQMAQGLVTTTKNKVEAIQGEIATTEAALQDAIARGNEHDIEAFTKLLDEQNEALMEAEEEFMQAWEDALQAAKDAFLADIEIISKELSDKLAGEKSSMDALRDSFDMAKEIEDDYLRDYEKMYLLDKMRRDVAKDIDESDSLNTRKELLAVQEKITKAMENGEKMSQYEIDNLQREYELTKARLALEEASQVKTQVTLTRDSEGNYSYVYGVDMDEVAKAEDEYNKKLYEMQKANDDYIHDLEEKIIDLQAEAVSKLQEAAEMYGTDSEEYAAAMAEIQEWYSTQLTFYSDQMNIALTNNQELVDFVTDSEIEAFGNVGYAYEDNVTQFNQLILSKQTGYETLEDMVADSTQAIQDSIQEMTAAEEQYQANNEVTMEKAGTTMEDFAGKYQENIDNSISKTKEFEKESGKMKDKVLENFQGVVDGVEAFLTTYSDWIDQYIAKTEEYIKSFEKLNEIWTGLTTTKEPDKPARTDPPKEDPPKSDGGGRRDNGGGRRNNNSGKAKKVAEAIWIWGGDKSGWGSGNSRKKKLKEKGVSNAQTIINKEVKEKGENKAFNYVKESEWKNLKNYFYGKFDTGGYTGNWSGDGRFALLHQKELVLNKDDTKNFLSGIEILRKISQMIDLNALVASSSSISGLKNVIASGNIAKEALEQFVNVTAEFPNVNSKQEIIEAFDNIVNLASQYASRT